MAEGDILWGRPEPSRERKEAYSGPPASEPAPPGWRPDQRESTPLPRKLPAIDDDAVDTAEREAARYTYVLGLVALITLLALVCWRVL